MFFVLGAAAVTFGVSFLGFFSLRRLFMPLAMIEVLLERVRIRPTAHSTPSVPDSYSRNRPLGPGPRHLICEPARMVANCCPPWFIGGLISGGMTWPHRTVPGQHTGARGFG